MLFISGRYGYRNRLASRLHTASTRELMIGIRIKSSHPGCHRSKQAMPVSTQEVGESITEQVTGSSREGGQEDTGVGEDDVYIGLKGIHVKSHSGEEVHIDRRMPQSVYNSGIQKNSRSKDRILEQTGIPLTHCIHQRADDRNSADIGYQVQACYL